MDQWSESLDSVSSVIVIHDLSVASIIMPKFVLILNEVSDKDAENTHGERFMHTYSPCKIATKL